jgi:uncharacterized RDD family membrane protein YckC
MESNKYPEIKDRVKAVLFDSLIIIFAMFIISDLFSRFDNVPNEYRMIAFIFVFFLYDPIAVAFFGGTIGHHINEIEIKRESSTEKNIYIHNALIRFAVKFFLGWLSFITINSSDKKRAIHDMISGSVVVYKEVEN